MLRHSKSGRGIPLEEGGAKGLVSELEVSKIICELRFWFTSASFRPGKTIQVGTSSRLESEKLLSPTWPSEAMHDEAAWATEPPLR